MRKEVEGVETYCTCLSGGALDESSECLQDSSRSILRQDYVQDHWTWDPNDKSSEVVLYGREMRTAMFHPGWSNGTAAVKGTKALNGTRSYWEIQLSHRVFGTSIMFGIAGKDVRNFRSFFTNLVGGDEWSWGLSHKGLIWHNGESRKFMKPFPEQTPTRIGLLFDGFEGCFPVLCLIAGGDEWSWGLSHKGLICHNGESRKFMKPFPKQTPTRIGLLFDGFEGCFPVLCLIAGGDEWSWGLSHKGLIWHNGESRKFMKPFPKQTPTRIGLLFDGFEGCFPVLCLIAGGDEWSWGLSHKGLICHNGESRKFMKPFPKQTPTRIGLLFDGFEGCFPVLCLIAGGDEWSWGLSHKGLIWHNGESRKFMKPFPKQTPTRIGLLFDGFEGCFPVLCLIAGGDEWSWGLSHKGLIWHNGESRKFMKPFPEQTPTRIGLLFDGFEGTLRYFKDGEDMGVAFHGLNRIPFPIFPIVSSTAARSEIRLASRYRLSFPTLESLSMTALVEGASDGRLPALPSLPPRLHHQFRERLTGFPTHPSHSSAINSSSCPLDPALPALGFFKR